MRDATASMTVFKLGGSVLTGAAAYRDAAAWLAEEIDCGRVGRVIAVVSAEFGHTDALALEARRINADPDAAALDLLWSTGELRSVALLTLALRGAGLAAVGLNAHETGLRAAGPDGTVAVNLLALRAAVARHPVVVVPGFLATRRQQLVTLGRGGTDLSAVLLSIALGAGECVLIKDVDGYFTADPATHADARRIDRLTHREALAKADDGCPLVQRQALDEARRAGLPLTIRSFHGTGTIVAS